MTYFPLPPTFVLTFYTRGLIPKNKSEITEIYRKIFVSMTKPIKNYHLFKHPHTHNNTYLTHDNEENNRNIIYISLKLCFIIQSRALPAPHDTHTMFQLPGFFAFFLTSSLATPNSPLFYRFHAGWHGMTHYDGENEMGKKT